MTANRATYGFSAMKDGRIQDLKDQIARRKIEVSQAQREYKDLLDNPPRVDAVSPQNAASPAGGRDEFRNNQQLSRMEQEIIQIKTMILEQKQSDAAAIGRASALTGSVDFDADMSATMQSIQSQMDNVQSEDEIRRFIDSQKQVIRKTQEKLDKSKKQYKLDKQKLTEQLKQSDPTEYARLKEILDDAKAQIEDRIDKVNKRVEKIKQMENRLG